MFSIIFVTIESTNFSLNDEEFSKIKEISNQVNSEILILFWQFAVSSLEELDIVSNQHMSIEMFLIRLMHLSSIKLNKNKDQEISLTEIWIRLRISRTGIRIRP